MSMTLRTHGIDKPSPAETNVVDTAPLSIACAIIYLGKGSLA